MREASIDELLERIAVLERDYDVLVKISDGYRDEAEELRVVLARCSKICSQTGLMAPDGDWARMQVIDTVEEALKEAKGVHVQNVTKIEVALARSMTASRSWRLRISGCGRRCGA